MTINNAGLELIKVFEGFRATAYRCPAGVWTIGYGHTSMAGPPAVKSGMRIAKPEAARILRDDVEKFADGIDPLIRVELNSNQFSALVSFAYNVGLGAFRGSSVLKSVNAGDFASVPRRLSLWTKAGGRVLPGLVRRRAAEGELFAMAEGSSLIDTGGMWSLPPALSAEMDDARGADGHVAVTPPEGKPMSSSTTVWATLASGGAGLVAAGKDAVYQATDLGTVLGFDGRAMVIVVIVAVIAVGAWWVINQRRNRSMDDGV